ncbi:hypothetical protein QY895_10765 [Latilactobacillus sakei]
MDTKQNLAQNLKLLMATTPVDHITVNQLTQAGERRAQHLLLPFCRY